MDSRKDTISALTMNHKTYLIKNEFRDEIIAKLGSGLNNSKDMQNVKIDNSKIFRRMPSIPIDNSKIFTRKSIPSACTMLNKLREIVRQSRIKHNIPVEHLVTLPAYKIIRTEIRNYINDPNWYNMFKRLGEDDYSKDIAFLVKDIIKEA